MAYTMWSSYPWSKFADVYLTCYKNEEREKWYFKQNPEKKDKILIPLQDADFTNEYWFAPAFNTKKDIDILYVSRIAEVKNIPIFVEALKKYKEKYKRQLRAVMLLGSLPDNQNANAKKILAAVKAKYGDIRRYVTLVDSVKYSEMCKYYSRAKFTILTSLIESKNRTIQESMACNTPIIVFKDHNKWARGKHEIISENAGLYVPEFSAEALADTIYNGLENYQGKFTPRKSYLRKNGRKHFVNTCVDSIPYFKDNLPEYEQGRIQDNLWVDLAMQDNYQLSFNDFIYGKNLAIQQVKCHENSHSLVDFFFSRFGIRH